MRNHGLPVHAHTRTHVHTESAEKDIKIGLSCSDPIVYSIDCLPSPRTHIWSYLLGRWTNGKDN